MPAMRQVTVELLTEVILEADILGRELVLERIPRIHRDHILNISPPPESW
jgi:hypothetical protein